MQRWDWKIGYRSSEIPLIPRSWRKISTITLSILRGRFARNVMESREKVSEALSDNSSLVKYKQHSAARRNGSIESQDISISTHFFDQRRFLDSRLRIRRPIRQWLIYYVLSFIDEMRRWDFKDKYRLRYQYFYSWWFNEASYSFSGIKYYNQTVNITFCCESKARISKCKKTFQFDFSVARYH